MSVPVEVRREIRLSYRRLVQHFSILNAARVVAAAAVGVVVAVAVADLHLRLPR